LSESRRAAGPIPTSPRPDRALTRAPPAYGPALAPT